MNANDSVNKPGSNACITPIELDRDIWLNRLGAGVRPDSLAEALAQSQAALEFAETVAGLIGKADHSEDAGAQVMALGGHQRRALLDGVHLAASLVGRRLDKLFLDDRELTGEGRAAMTESDGAQRGGVEAR